MYNKYSILVVDDDATSLTVAKACLKRWNYEVMTVSHALQALSLLEEKGENGEIKYDVVLADVHMPIIDGFQLMEHVHKNFNIPVVLVSGDYKTEAVQKGLSMGALAYLIKPVRADNVRHLWEHSVLWKNREINAWRRFTQQAHVPRNICSSSRTTETEKNPRDKKAKKCLWTPELHNRFVEGILILGAEDAVPKTILEVMNVQSITREQVASHLQKFRKLLNRVFVGKARIDEPSKYWIDCHYYSSIVGGNPNLILIDKILEGRRTKKSTAPIRASLPLPPFNEAEASSSRRKNITMSMPNNYASPTVNVAAPGLGNVTFQSDVVSQPNYHFTNGGLIDGANKYMFPTTNSIVPSGGTTPILNSLISEQPFNVVPQSSNILFTENNINADMQVGNVQSLDPNFGTSYGLNPNENTSGINQQLGNVELDPIIDDNSFGANESGNWMMDNNTAGMDAVAATENTFLGNNPSLNLQHEDWEWLLNLDDIDDDEDM